MSKLKGGRLIFIQEQKASYAHEQEGNTPGTAGGPGGRDRTLAVKSRKNVRKITFFFNKIKFTQKKYWVKNYFAHGSFPEVGQKQKTEKNK